MTLGQVTESLVLHFLTRKVVMLEYVYINVYIFSLFFFFKKRSIICLQCLVSGIQPSDSVIHTYVYLFQNPSPFRLLQDIDIVCCAIYSRSLLVVYFIYSSGIL